MLTLPLVLSRLITVPRRVMRRFRMVCTSATQLETLSVRDCAMVDDTGLSCIAITCPALRAVCLEDCPAISDAGAPLAPCQHSVCLGMAQCWVVLYAAMSR